MARAMSSLPVPDSPRSSTVVFGARDLRDLLVDALHRAAVADDPGEVVALPQLLLQVRVLVDQPLVLRGDEPLHLERLPDHRGDDAEERLRALVVAVGLELQVDAERADDAAVEADRDADEAGFLGLRVVAAVARNTSVGSRLTRGTITALPVSTTLPMTPSPSV